MKKFRARIMAEAANSCDEADRKACRAAAKADMVAAGMLAREFGMVKKHSEVMGAAEVYANCLQSGINATDCEQQAKDEYMSAGGASGANGTGQGSWSFLRAKIVALGNGLDSGAEVQMRKKMLIAVDAATDGTSCDASIGIALAAKAK